MTLDGSNLSVILLIKKTQYKISQDKNDTKILMWIGETGGAVLDRKRDFQDVEDASFLVWQGVSNLVDCIGCKSSDTKFLV